MAEKLDELSIAGAVAITWALMLFALGMGASYFSGWAEIVGFISKLYIGYGPGTLGAVTGAVWGFIDKFIKVYILAWLYNYFRGFRPHYTEEEHEEEGIILGRT